MDLLDWRLEERLKGDVVDEGRNVVAGWDRGDVDVFDHFGAALVYLFVWDSVQIVETAESEKVR